MKQDFYVLTAGFMKLLPIGMWCHVSRRKVCTVSEKLLSPSSLYDMEELSLNLI
jgi:hypothetical protein